MRAEGRRISASSVRPGLFAYVPQGNCLLSGTAREVVAFADGDGAPDDARVRDALYAACADEFVDGLPGGLDARLGERGAALSEGRGNGSPLPELYTAARPCCCSTRPRPRSIPLARSG